MSLRKAILLIAVVLATLPTGVSAQESADNGQPSVTAEKIPTLGQVTVVGQAENTLTGSNSINREQLEILPAKNGSINEVIGVLPGVQLPEQGRTSIKGGEIVPPNISISGGAVYQNNFLIDGISNNSILDPMNDDVNGAQFVPGHPQATFLPASLVDEIRVYRYNIPASFGRFTGGVVDASIRSPESTFWGEVSYRITRDEWTEFHVDDAQNDDFENPVDFSYQPKFTKQDAGFTLNIPLAQDFSLLTAYHISHSKIPIDNFDDSKDQKRRNENFLASLLWDINNRSTLKGTVQYSPYEGDYFNGLAKDSDFTIEGGGWQASLDYKRDLDIGRFSILGAIKGSRNNRDAPANLFGWLAYVDDNVSSKPWGIDVGTNFRGEIISREGSIGSLESSQNSVEFKTDFISEPVPLKQTVHVVNAGASFEYIRGKLERDEQHNQYYLNRTPANNENLFIDCGDNDPACIYQEQLFLDRSHFPAASTSATINLVDVYVDDTITWQNLELRPGLHVSYDDYMKNTNVAPRLAASYDIFGNGNTILIGGWNRYYGKTLMTYKLREASPGADIQDRGVACEVVGPDTVCTAEPWPDYDLPSTIYRYSKADTPYADETVLGIDQNIFGSRLKLTWLQRKGRDEFARERTDTQEDGQRYYELTNNGESEHDEYTLEWERTWASHYLAINATYQESTRSNESYTDNFYGDLYLEDLVWYEGDYIKRADLPRQDFSRPWIANLIYSTRLPWGITFTNVTSYRSGYEGLDSLTSAEEIERGLPTAQTSYIKARFPEAWTFDWKFDWESSIYKGQSLNVSVEINNVFNEKVQVGDGGIVSDSNPKDYELGRQFWLGMTYKF